MARFLRHGWDRKRLAPTQSPPFVSQSNKLSAQAADSHESSPTQKRMDSPRGSSHGHCHALPRGNQRPEHRRQPSPPVPRQPHRNRQPLRRRRSRAPAVLVRAANQSSNAKLRPLANHPANLLHRPHRATNPGRIPPSRHTHTQTRLTRTSLFLPTSSSVAARLAHKISFLACHQATATSAPATTIRIYTDTRRTTWI
jgi:hypothetical protein